MCTNDEHRSRDTYLRPRVRLEKLTVVDTVKKFHPSYGKKNPLPCLHNGPNAKLWLCRRSLAKF